MIVYIADRNLNILATASTGLPNGLKIASDSKSESIESGVATFECEIVYDDESLADNVNPGGFLLRNSDGDSEFYHITEVETDTESKTVRVYCEDAGLDLLSTQAAAYSAAAAMTVSQYVSLFASGWTVGEDESTSSLKLSWDSESTVTERLLSVAESFGCELSYSFDVDDTSLQISTKYVNFYAKRGNQTAVVQARLGKEISKISVKQSTENLATAYKATGTSINLKGYSYHPTFEEGEDEYCSDYWYKQNKDSSITDEGKIRNLSAIARWSGALSSGLMVRAYSAETKDKATLASMAKTELSKYCDAEVNYEVEFVELDASIGDRINVIDDAGGLYLETRILELTRSETEGSVSATLGEYVLKTSGMRERVNEISADVKACVVEEDLRDYINWDEENGLDMQTLSEGTVNLGGELAEPEEALYIQSGEAEDVNTGYVTRFKQAYRKCKTDETLDDRGEVYFELNASEKIVECTVNPPTPTQWAAGRTNYYVVSGYEYISCVKDNDGTDVADEYDSSEDYYDYSTFEAVTPTQAEYEANPSAYCYCSSDGEHYVRIVSGTTYYKHCIATDAYDADATYCTAGASTYTTVSITQAEYEANPTGYYRIEIYVYPAGQLTQSLINEMQPAKSESTEITFFGGEGRIVETAYYDTEGNKQSVLNIASEGHMDIEAEGKVGIDGTEIDLNGDVVFTDEVFNLMNGFAITAEEAYPVTVASGSYDSGSFAITKAGYYPIGVIGYYLEKGDDGSGNTYGRIYRVLIETASRAVGSANIGWSIRADGGKVNKCTLLTHVLWAKAK